MGWESPSHTLASYTIKIFHCKVKTSFYPLSVWKMLTVPSTDSWSSFVWGRLNLSRTEVCSTAQLFSASDALFSVKETSFCFCKKCRLLSGSQTKKTKIKLEVWHTSRSAGLSQFHPRFDKLLHRKAAVFKRQNCLPVGTSTLGEGRTPATRILSGYISNSKRPLQFQQSELSPSSSKCHLVEISTSPVSLHNVSQLTSAQGEINKETKCK